jgi:hypothetical protein
VIGVNSLAAGHLTLVPALSPEIADAIDRAVALEPEARPSAIELADALAGATSSPGVPTPVPRSLTVHGSSSGRHDTPLPVPVPAKPIPWKPIAIGVGIALLIGIVAALSQRSSNPDKEPVAKPGELRVEPAEPLQPGELRVTTPEIATTDRRANKDWNKIVDKLHKGELGEARKKLSEFERKWGETDETTNLRDQLPAFERRGEDD